MTTVVASAPAPAALRQPVPLALLAPASILFVAVVIVPLAMTVLLSFHDWGQ
jgi:putative spermidine/putrescine transport system permease protein